VIAEPDASSVPSEENPYPDVIDGVHKVSAVPPESLPKNFDGTVADEVIPLTTAQAREAALALIAEEGVFAGISSGAALWAATQLAGRPENAGKLIVAVLPDTGERYLASATG
jgi:cysteine synthase A